MNHPLYALAWWGGAGRLGGMFVVHLLIIVAGLVGLVLFVAYPKFVLFSAAVLGCGYLGSQEGFVGTVLGMLAGCVVGGALAGSVAGPQWIYRKLNPELTPEEKETHWANIAATEKARREADRAEKDAREAVAKASAERWARFGKKAKAFLAMR